MIFRKSQPLKYGANVYVAYNRRFYAVVQGAVEIIGDDGGISSVNFEFTEWSSIHERAKSSRKAKETVLLGNSPHVIDLAFFFAGHPKEVLSYVGGALEWHPNGCIYTGAGYTDKDVLFSYNANWDAPGRWGVEVLTRAHRLIFRPLEKLQLQDKGGVAIYDEKIDDSLDEKFKIGLFEKVGTFLRNPQDNRMMNISEHLSNIKIYEKIAGVDTNGKIQEGKYRI